MNFKKKIKILCIIACLSGMSGAFSIKAMEKNEKLKTIKQDIVYIKNNTQKIEDEKIKNTNATINKKEDFENKAEKIEDEKKVENENLYLNINKNKINISNKITFPQIENSIVQQPENIYSFEKILSSITTIFQTEFPNYDLICDEKFKSVFPIFDNVNFEKKFKSLKDENEKNYKKLKDVYSIKNQTDSVNFENQFKKNIINFVELINDYLENLTKTIRLLDFAKNYLKQKIVVSKEENNVLNNLENTYYSFTEYYENLTKKFEILKEILHNCFGDDKDIKKLCFKKDKDSAYSDFIKFKTNPEQYNLDNEEDFSSDNLTNYDDSNLRNTFFGMMSIIENLAIELDRYDFSFNSKDVKKNLDKIIHNIKTELFKDFENFKKMRYVDKHDIYSEHREALNDDLSIENEIRDKIQKFQQNKDTNSKIKKFFKEYKKNFKYFDRNLINLYNGIYGFINKFKSDEKIVFKTFEKKHKTIEIFIDELKKIKKESALESNNLKNYINELISNLETIKEKIEIIIKIYSNGNIDQKDEDIDLDNKTRAGYKEVFFKSWVNKLNSLIKFKKEIRDTYKYYNNEFLNKFIETKIKNLSNYIENNKKFSKDFYEFFKLNPENIKDILDSDDLENIKYRGFVTQIPFIVKKYNDKFVGLNNVSSCEINKIVNLNDSVRKKISEYKQEGKKDRYQKFLNQLTKRFMTALNSSKALPKICDILKRSENSIEKTNQQILKLNNIKNNFYADLDNIKKYNPNLQNYENLLKTNLEKTNFPTWKKYTNYKDYLFEIYNPINLSREDLNYIDKNPDVLKNLQNKFIDPFNENLKKIKDEITINKDNFRTIFFYFFLNYKFLNPFGKILDVIKNQTNDILNTDIDEIMTLFPDIMSNFFEEKLLDDLTKTLKEILKIQDID